MEKRDHMLVSSGQIRWMQLLLDFLKEQVHSREEDPLNNFSLPVSLSPRLSTYVLNMGLLSVSTGGQLSLQ